MSTPDIEKSATDAPVWYNANEARAWAAGYNAALEARIAELEKEVERLNISNAANATRAENLFSKLFAAEQRIEKMTEALEIIAGRRQCIDNLMGNRDVAEAALSNSEREGGNE